MTTNAKRELSEKELSELKNGDNVSARYREIGFISETNGISFRLADKVIYPINECPHCDSKSTFHRRVQESGDIVGNVWRDWQIVGSKGYYYAKLDYCLDCHKEFLIELYIFEKLTQ